MEWIKAFLVNFIAFLAVAPFFSFIALWFISFVIYNNKKKATAIAMDITTFFLIAVVSVMFNEIFNTGLGFWIILLLFLIAAGLVGNAQNRLKGRLDIVKLYKVIWRIGFLILGVLYILFILIGIIKNIFSA
jgi:hypothetical protein